MRRLITRDDISAALLREKSGESPEDIMDEAGMSVPSRRAFLRMRKRYAPLSDLLRDLNALQEEKLRLQSTVTDLTLEVCRLTDLLYPKK